MDKDKEREIEERLKNLERSVNDVWRYLKGIREIEAESLKRLKKTYNME